MRKIVCRLMLVAALTTLAALTFAGVNPQAYPKPTNVAVGNTPEGNVLVSWGADEAPVHRVGWTQETDLRAAQAAGDWLEAFHFADTKRSGNYTVKYLPHGRLYWFIVGSSAQRFDEVNWSDWANLITGHSTATLQPPPTPTPTPTPTTRPDTFQSDVELHLAIAWLPQDTFYPWLTASTSHLPFRPMWENLTTISPETGAATILPQLAREWKVSADAKEYTFYLQEGVPFHFGHGEFTVRDVILTIDQQMSDPLAGCKAPLKRFMGADSMTEMIENGSMEVIGDYSFKMKLAQPQTDVASWWFNTLMPCAAVRSAAQYSAEGDAMFENGPAGTGAYQFVRRDLREFTDYEAVPYDHWRVNAGFKNLRITTTPEDLVRLALLLAGEVNMADVPRALHQQALDEGMEVFQSPMPSWGLTILPLGQYYVSEVNWNPDTEPWNAPGETGNLVREAMNRSINRERISNELFQGRSEPMYNTIFHPSLEGWNPRWEEEFDEKYGYDPELAKRLLDQAGFPGANGQNRFSMEVWQTSLPGLPETHEVAQTVARSFQDIGIDVRLVEAEFARALDAFRDRHDAHFILPMRQTIRPIQQNARIYYYTGPTDPRIGRPTGGVAYIEDPLYDQTYERLLVETDPAERHRLIQAMGDDIYDTYRTIPIVNVRSSLVVNPQDVAEYKFGVITGTFGHLEYAQAAR